MKRAEPAGSAPFQHATNDPRPAVPGGVGLVVIRGGVNDHGRSVRIEQRAFDLRTRSAQRRAQPSHAGTVCHDVRQVAKMRTSLLTLGTAVTAGFISTITARVKHTFDPVT